MKKYKSFLLLRILECSSGMSIFKNIYNFFNYRYFNLFFWIIAFIHLSIRTVKLLHGEQPASSITKEYKLNKIDIFSPQA